MRSPPLIRALSESYGRLGAGGARVLLAVSGGADSTALLVGSAECAALLGTHFEVATVDHGLRKEAAEEVRAVQALARARGLRCHVRALRLEKGAGLEARARAARERALEEIRAEAGLDFVATAHTATDQAETVLMRLARGTALRGAAGILEAKGRFIRPLLGVTRQQVLELLASRRQAYASDPMNADPSFLRTRIREGVLPALAAAAGPQVVQRLASFASCAHRDEQLLAAMAERARERLSLEGGGLDAAGLRALDEPLRARVLAALLEEGSIPVDSALLERAGAALARGRHTGLGRSFQLRCEGGRVRIVRPAATPPGGVAELRPGTEISLPSGWILAMGESPPPGVPRVGLPRDVPLPLEVRARRPGDLVRRSAGWVKLQELLIDLKVPEEERDRLPVIADASGMVRWVVGVWPRRLRAPAGGWYVWARLGAGRAGGGKGAGL